MVQKKKRERVSPKKFTSKAVIFVVIAVILLVGIYAAVKFNAAAKDAVAGEAIKLGTAKKTYRPPISCGTVIDEKWPSVIVLQETDPIVADALNRRYCLDGVTITKSFVTFDGNGYRIGRYIEDWKMLYVPFIIVKGSGVTLMNFHFVSSENFGVHEAASRFSIRFSPMVKVEGGKARVTKNFFINPYANVVVDGDIHDATIDGNLFHAGGVLAPSGNRIYKNDFTYSGVPTGSPEEVRIDWPGASKPTLCSPKPENKGNFFAFDDATAPVGPCGFSPCHFTNDDTSFLYNRNPACSS